MNFIKAIVNPVAEHSTISLTTNAFLLACSWKTSKCCYFLIRHATGLSVQKWQLFGLWRSIYLLRLYHFRSPYSSRSRCPGGKSWHNLRSGHGTWDIIILLALFYINWKHLKNTLIYVSTSSGQSTSVSHAHIPRMPFLTSSLCCRTSPWRCTCATTGRTSASPSPAPTIRAWPSTAGWPRRSGCQTCSLSTPRGPSFTTPPQKMSCWGSIPTETCCTVWGKANLAAFTFYIHTVCSIFKHCCRYVKYIHVYISVDWNSTVCL